MSEKDLNIEYICEKTLLNKDDELVPIILSLIQESYKAGLCQTEFDNTMNLIEENQELKKQLENSYCNRTDCAGRIKDSKKYDSLVQAQEAQQKEFIKFLEDELLDARYYARDIAHYIEYVLRKYKEIVNGTEQK
mgnify:CR=1 FL=1|jgi:hypothetical protein